ncbi:mandelate racemase/muconate lactonizing enzyme family protein [Guptibacillus hwajinpoensis]|uniref:Mandelate racemase n=1 Tax=Guptibacillus hwajinpoensis TaxID=208199 RepID=A0A0J6CLZ5_9BACL|nr:mandelate racemase/muconate lactonizing enzyme family protein [Alkalihalobacillus macyae]KMM37251.1 mandelate racemase [Alkalihalobacillus macyae]
MKIIDIKTYILSNQLQQPFAYSQGWVTHRSTTVVEVVTDLGLSGWGETFSVGLQTPEIAASIIESTFKPLLMGEDPTNTEVLWHKMYHHTRDYGRKGVVIGAISAIDIALWDIHGKVTNQPIYKLLGGAFREKIQAYATGFFRTKGQGEAKEMANEAMKHASDGFDLMKVKIGFGIQDDLDVINGVRNAIGDKITLMIDANHAYSAVDAVRLGLSLEKMDLRWFEEPVVPESIRAYQEVKRKLSIPIAGGEAEYTVFGFKNLLENNAIDIAQPDVCLVGGFTACKHIMALAYAYGVEVNPHVWGTAIGQYASLHLLAATPVSNHSLFAQQPVFEYDTSMHPFRTELVEQPIEHKNGWVDVPQGSGLGIKINRSFVENKGKLVTI